MDSLLFLFIFLFDKCLGKTAIQQKFHDYYVTPDVILTPPVMPLGVEFANKFRLAGADVLWPLELKDIPSLRWGADAKKYYTVLLIDPDAPSRTNPIEREYLHWLVINIPGLRLSSGETVFEYVPPHPPPDTGLHRYVFLVYEQPGKYTYDGSRELKNRARFSAEQFAAEHKLGRAVAGNFFLTQHDGNQQ